MPENIVSIILPALFIVAWVLVIVRIIIKTIKNKYASVKTVKAIVVDKHKIETFSKYFGNEKKKYVVVFSVNGKKKSFYVPSFHTVGTKLMKKAS